MNVTLANSRDELIKEVRYRATYRGTLELDLVCRPLVEGLESLSDGELAAVRALLLNKEGDLMSWLVDGVAAPVEWAPAVGVVRGLFIKARAAA